MIFSEIYGVYYKIISEAIKMALNNPPLRKNNISDLVRKYGFAETALFWNDISSDINVILSYNQRENCYETTLSTVPTMPITTLEKRWMKSVSLDPRIRLFQDEVYDYLEDVEPLFTKEDYEIFDQYFDGDPYEDETYIKHFRMLLEAIRQKNPLEIEMKNQNSEEVVIRCIPKCLEYSEKNDKFRLIGDGEEYQYTINVGRILSIKKMEKDSYKNSDSVKKEEVKELKIVVTDEKNALERVLLHFAHYPKKAERSGEKQYTITLNYDKSEEREILIRILSFGSHVKVISPDDMINLIKERLVLQQGCTN